MVSQKEYDKWLGEAKQKFANEELDLNKKVVKEFKGRIKYVSSITADSQSYTYRLENWAYSTNHKDIGTMYLIFAIVAGLIGSAFSVLMRMELMYPGDGILTITIFIMF